MFAIKIFTVGKTKEHWLEEALEEYTQRLKPNLKLEWVFAKDDEGLARLLEKEKKFIALDPQGKLLSSEEFSKKIIQILEQEDSRLSLVIGGADGIPEAIKKKALTLLSLSPLTFTHQLTRLILLEQLYRAFEIDRGSPYHR
jgi:23S rRNA (pseudouridine1915-N3)-methyltransferase